MNEHWDLIGHDWAVELLSQNIGRDAVRHAYLFAGPAGVGRLSLALRFAQALNCTQPIKPGVPCGVCRDCRQIDAQRHPDLALVQAEAEGGTLKVDQVREARRSLTLKPFQARYRVAIFQRFQEANDNASNALLKTLEEAPSYAVLILTADSPEALLPTIVSRCEILRLRPLPLSLVEELLRSRGADPEKAGLLASVSGGRPGYALQLLNDPAALALRAEKLNDLQALLPARRVEKFAYADQLARDKDGMRTSLTVWLSYWRDVLLRAAGASTPIANIDRSREIESLAGHLKLSEARRVVANLEKALGQLDGNVNARLVAEVLLLDWPKPAGGRHA
jgi:DNA polymerase III subunit delta'